MSLALGELCRLSRVYPSSWLARGVADQRSLWRTYAEQTSVLCPALPRPSGPGLAPGRADRRAEKAGREDEAGQSGSGHRSLAGGQSHVLSSARAIGGGPSPRDAPELNDRRAFASESNRQLMTLDDTACRPSGTELVTRTRRIP